LDVFFKLGFHSMVIRVPHIYEGCQTEKNGVIEKAQAYSSSIYCVFSLDLSLRFEPELN
jgi:hypothetical protein